MLEPLLAPESTIDSGLLGRAATVVANSSSLESISRPFLDLLHRLTGLESTYLTEVRTAEDEQSILFSDDRGAIAIPEGLTVPWYDTLCRRALDSGRRSTSNVERDLPGSAAARELGLRSYVSVPVLGADDALMGTLCGASSQSTELSPEVLEVMAMLAQLIADQWERDRARETALQRAEAAEARLRERATFLAVAEHKLKSPLALMRGWSDILADSWDTLPTSVRAEALSTVQQASRDAVRQVDELLVEARSEVLSTQLDPVLVSLSPLVTLVARQLQAAASDAHMVDAKADVVATVLADREALWQVLWHLGENAVKYSPDGGRIVLDVDLDNGEGAVVSVTDEGLGIPDDIDVFAPFTRGTSDFHTSVNGTGLGLHIVHNLVQAMGGTVTAERRPDRGSRFRVTLPLAKYPAGSLAACSSAKV